MNVIFSQPTYTRFGTWRYSGSDVVSHYRTVYPGGLPVPVLRAFFGALLRPSRSLPFTPVDILPPTVATFPVSTGGSNRRIVYPVAS